MKNFFAKLFGAQKVETEKFETKVVTEEMLDAAWEAKTDPLIRDLRQKARDNDYKGVFELLEAGVNPNLPVYEVSTESIDHGLDYYNYRHIMHVLDCIYDTAMVRLLREYGAKTSKELSNEEAEGYRRKIDKDRKEHERRSNALVDDLLRQRAKV